MSAVHIDGVGGASLERLNKVLAGVPGGVWKAASGALKRAGDTAKTRAGELAAAEYAIGKGDFMRNVAAKARASGGGAGIASMEVSYAGNVLPLLVFNTKFSRGGLLQTKVMRGGGAAALRRAFAARAYGHLAVFERAGAARHPLEQKFGPSTGHMMRNERVVEAMDKAIRETYEKRVEHEINRVLNGWGR